MFGQFSEGLSKTHVTLNPHVGFLVMSPEKQVWRGRARWTHAVRSGEDYELYNRKPMFRYNSYFGIHTVHYLDLIAIDGRESLSVAQLLRGWLLLAPSSVLLRGRAKRRVLRPWAERHVASLATMKFLCHVDQAGYPVISPVVPCRCAGGGRILFAYRRELSSFPAGGRIAIFALNLQMESVLVRGTFRGYRGIPGMKAGTIDIDWVYNSMPPKQGTIYPEEPLGPVVLRDDGPVESMGAR